tara:strand:+ start:623 stop:1153 length:531 start_codon:yes stop_codon:yes gene_type:complete
MNSKSKTALKNIVKECLIEILAEGLVGSNRATISESRELRGAMQESYERSSSRRISEHSLQQPTQVTKSRQPSQRRSSYLDSIKVGIDEAAERPNPAIQNKVRSITNDPVMSDILADTAMTTLREQKEGARPSGPSVMASGDQAAKIVNQSSPEDLFGGQASKWADLAFAPSIRNR